MDTSHLTFQYDKEGDILHISTCEPYAGQESDEIGDEVVARFNPKTGEIENLEILFFSARFKGEFGEFSLPISAQFRAHAVAGLD